FLIDRLLSQFGRSLKSFDVMPLPQQDWAAMLGNPLIRDQRDYDGDEQTHLAEERIPTLNPEQ
ncbi:hypothetical protein FA15DRAFT_577377, partial [Coprinopsis marcescibilis]